MAAISSFEHTQRASNVKNGFRLLIAQLAQVYSKTYKYVRPGNARTEMYAVRVVCCPLVSHVEYASRASLTLRKDGTAPDG